MITRRSLAFAAALAAGAFAAAVLVPGPRPLQAAADGERRLLYVASPGVRNYVEYGGVGLLVFDITHGHRFVKRIPTFPEVAGKEPENVKGIVASARTGRLYVSTPQRLGAFDLVTERMVWSRTYEGGCDRMAISPDGKQLYVPSFEGPHWTVVDGATGNVLGTIVTNSGAHNTIYGPSGKLAYLAGLKSPMLNVADGATRRVVKQVGPFGNAIRPFTVNGSETLVFVNVNALLGFEVGDLQTGRLLHRVEVDGYKQGPVKRHGCPSHGIGLTPDEKELWLADGANETVHIFDATVMPPRQVASIKLRDQPGWVTFGIDGQYAYPSTGEVIDTRTRKIVATLADETGRAVQSEKLLEIVFSGGRPVRAGDQFGLGARK
jgi:DNA-binding beta-propeller fold protein YncE